MQAIVETVFDAVYLVSVITIGILMIRGCKGSHQFKLFGLMAVVLGAGDSFHLIPRALALCTTGLENFTVPLGLGKWITSVTMTVFYVLLYYVWRERYRVKGSNGLTAAVYGLAAVRVILCMMPQNQWLSDGSPLSWGIYRNIPFALMGLLIIVLFYRSAKEHDDAAFRWMWMTIVLSFGFYIPVVLWANTVPMIGMLMIPKTCAYVWTVLIGYSAMNRIGMILLDKTGSGKLASPLPVMNWQGAFYVCTGSLTEYLMFAAITMHPAIRPGPQWLLRWSLPQEWVHRHRTEQTGHG